MSQDEREYVPVTAGRPIPSVSADTEFFWAEAKKHRLAIQCCADCGEFRHPPMPACARCHSLEWTAHASPGQGRLYTFTVHRHPPHPSFPQPPTIAVIDLDEGTRLVANFVGDPEELRIGERMQVYFVDQEEGWNAPHVRRCGTSEDGDDQ